MRTSHIRLFLLALAIQILVVASYAQPVGNGYVVPVGQLQADSVTQLSDQKAGAILVFPFYGSDGTAANDTRLTITNVGPAGFVGAPAVQNSFGSTTDILNNLMVHLFWLDGSSCSQADGYVCFTKFQSWTFKASEWDPVTPRGVLIAVAVDPQGYPISYNGLVGNAFVNCNVTQSGITEKWLDNYGAESFASVGQTLNPLPNGQVYWYSGILAGGGTASPQNPGTVVGLLFDAGAHQGFIGYDEAPGGFAVEFQSPADAVGQTILTVGLNGTIGGALNGNGFVNGVGLIYRSDEKEYSFTGTAQGCQVLNRITSTNPRILGGLGTQIPSGKSGTAYWNIGVGAVGLFITPATGNNKWSGIRGLHKTRGGGGTLIAPVFMPTCVV